MSREPSSTNEALSAWLDGELDPAEAAELEAELARDPSLKAELASLESVVRLLRDEGPAQAPLGFHHRVMARIDEEHPERPSWWAWLRRPFGVPLEGWAIALAAAIVLVLVLPKGSPPEEGPTGETSPAVVQTPSLSKPLPDQTIAKDAAPAAAETPSAATRQGVEQVREPVARPTRPEIIPGKVTTGEGADVTPTVVLPPPTAPAPAPIPQGTAEGNDPVQRFTVRSEDPKVWQAVLRTCGRLGKTVGKLSGTMSASVQKATCHLPQTALPDFETELRKSGYDVTVAPSDGLVPGTDVAVEVTVVLGGGAPVQAAPPAGSAE